MGEHVIVVEDEADIADLVALHLRRQGYRVTAFLDGEEGLTGIRRASPDLVILDVMLPGLNGWEICKEMRRDDRLAAVPILMLSARSEDVDVVTGLELGADDYVTKPFSPAVLLSRVKNLLRRRDAGGSKEEVLKIGELEVDGGRHEVRVNEELVELTHTEFSILRYLAERPGFVRSRRDILSAIDGSHVLERTVDVHMTSLRRKLGAVGERIETVRGTGYRLRD